MSSSPQPSRCKTPIEPNKAASRLRSPRSNDWVSIILVEATTESLRLIATKSQLRIRTWGRTTRLLRIRGGAVGFARMDLEQLPPQVRPILKSLDHAMKAREPAIRAKVMHLRAAHPHHTSDQLAHELIRSTRRRVAATGALSGATAIAPGLGVGLGLGAGFDWIAVTGLGRAAMRYYGPGGPGARPLLLAPENPSHVELGN